MADARGGPGVVSSESERTKPTESRVASRFGDMLRPDSCRHRGIAPCRRRARAKRFPVRVLSSLYTELSPASPPLQMRTSSPASVRSVGGLGPRQGVLSSCWQMVRQTSRVGALRSRSRDEVARASSVAIAGRQAASVTGLCTAMHEALSDGLPTRSLTKLRSPRPNAAQSWRGTCDVDGLPRGGLHGRTI